MTVLCRYMENKLTVSRTFHSFDQLPPELRIRVYELHLEDLPPVRPGRGPDPAADARQQQEAAGERTGVRCVYASLASGQSAAAEDAREEAARHPSLRDEIY